MKATMLLVLALLMASCSPPPPLATGSSALEECADGGASAEPEVTGGSSGVTEPQPKHRVYVPVLGGQSNMIGAGADDRPSGLPDASVPFWRNDYYYYDGPHAFVPLNVYARGNTFSVEMAMARALQAAGHSVAVIKLARGATYVNSWLPGKLYGVYLYPEIAEAWAAARALYPDHELVPLFVWYQGEEEAVYHHSAGEEAELRVVRQWSTHFAAVRSGVESIVGPVHPYIMRCNSAIPGGTHVVELQAQQALAVDDPSDLILTDDAQLRPDGKHNTGAGSNMLGARLGAKMVADIAAGRY